MFYAVFVICLCVGFISVICIGTTLLMHIAFWYETVMHNAVIWYDSVVHFGTTVLYIWYDSVVHFGTTVLYVWVRQCCTMWRPLANSLQTHPSLGYH